MTTLPPELASWADVLATFAPDLGEVLGNLARRLDLLLGRVRARPRPVGDDPEGYDGLDRRGPYDRLLLSEWALADELPDEFDRRAVSGEHAFLRLDRRDRAKGARTLVLFDGGPDQLGGPRIVQLAALVVLWRRALTAHAELQWGVLQGSALATTVDRASIQAFLGGRAARGSTREDLARARASAGDVDETWIVASDGLLAAAAGPGALHLALSEVVAPDVAAVDARLTRGGARLGDARLDLPPGAIGRRLLTDPFPPPVAHPPQPRRRGPAEPPPPDQPGTWLPFPGKRRDPDLVRFLPGTAQLLVTMPNNDALLWGFADGRPKSPKPRVHSIYTEERVAIGYARQRTIVIGRKPDGQVHHPDRPPAPVRGGPPPAPGHGFAATCGETTTCLDHAGTLFVFPMRDRTHVVRHPGRFVATWRFMDTILTASARDDGLALERVGLDGGLLPYANLPGGQAWVGAGSPHFPEHLDLLLTVDAQGVARGHQFVLNWIAYPPKVMATEPAHIDEGVSVLGVARAGTGAAVITHDPRRGVIRHPGTGVALSPARTPLSITLSPDGRTVAWRTPEGFLEAWSLVTGEPVLLRYPG